MKSAKKRYIVLPVNIVGSRLLHTATTIENTAQERVILPTDSERQASTMNKDYRANLERYLVSMLQAKQMLSMGILTPKDYATIDTIMTEKYGISSCSLYRGIDLIYDGFRGNISQCKEVTQCQEE